MNAEPQNTPQAPVESQAKAKLDIGISQPAVEAIKTQIKKRGKENTSLRVGIRGRSPGPDGTCARRSSRCSTTRKRGRTS